MPGALAQSRIVHHLVDLGLLDARMVVDGGLTVIDASRRNNVFLVSCAGGPQLVVKQAAADTGATLAREAEVVRALSALPDVAPLVPQLAHYDAAAARLVLRTPAGGRDLNAQHRSARTPVLTAAALGRALATVHGAAPALAAAAAAAPWGLSLGAPPLARLHDLSAGALDMLARLQSSAELCERLAQLAATTGEQGFVHGDLRWDNCLALARPGATRRTRILLIDWEMAGAGEPALDVATVLAEYLRLWVGSVPIVDPAQPGLLLALAGRPLTRLRPAIGAFWGAYRRTRALELRRVVELTAVRLLQSALERAQGLHAASAHVITLLQLADNLLREPDEAALHLLGLRT